MVSSLRCGSAMWRDRDSILTLKNQVYRRALVGLPVRIDSLCNSLSANGAQRDRIETLASADQLSPQLSCTVLRRRTSCHPIQQRRGESMRRHLIVIAAIVNFLLCLSAFGQVERQRDRIRITRPTIVAQPATDSVVIYSRKNFGGESMVLPIGDHRLTNLKPASIRVPAGLVAYVYEHVDSAGGYGTLVDLMEDHADLAEFGLSGNVEMITVFASTLDGLVWARNRMTNGQFVAGHWERLRAGGSSSTVNTVAVASPPVPSRAPAAPTSIQQQGTTWTITNLGPQSPADAARWSSADATMGVIGSDFRGPQEIGSAAIERASNNPAIPDWFNFWYPNKQRNDHRSVVYYKRTLTG